MAATKTQTQTQTQTQATAASVEDHIAARASGEQAADCQALIALCQRVTQQAPRMWGPSIVGFGRYAYKYPSGHAGEAPLAGFAIRGRELVVYLSCEDQDQAELLARLGKHKMGKACLYFKRLADLDTQVLEQLVAQSVQAVQRRYPSGPS